MRFIFGFYLLFSIFYFYRENQVIAISYGESLEEALDQVELIDPESEFIYDRWDEKEI